MNILQQAAPRLERLEALDKVARQLAATVGRAVRPTVVRNAATDETARATGVILRSAINSSRGEVPISAWPSCRMPELLHRRTIHHRAGTGQAKDPRI